jgi:hypothetical protein
MFMQWNIKGKKAMLCAVLFCMTLLLNGCLVESDAPILSESNSTKMPDISGTYRLNEDGLKAVYVFTGKKGTNNAYTVTADGKDAGTAIIDALADKGTFIMQVEDDKIYLLPMIIEKAGLRVYLPGNTENAMDGKIMRELLAKNNVKGSDDKLQRGDMTPQEYTTAVKAVFSGMFAANGLGKGLLLEKQ